MAIYHCSIKPLSRSAGRSAVAAAAYRAGERLENARDGLVHDFTRRSGVEHTEIVLPQGLDPEWAKDRSTLWNAAEASEKRKDARTAREVEIALPHELTEAQRLALARDFAHGLADRYGVAVDIAIHAPHDASDVRNHHAHLLMTTRKVEKDGLGEKSSFELDNKKLRALGLPLTQEQMLSIRADWEDRTNRHLAMAGLEIQIDHRSHRERGLEFSPTEHVGVHATQMERRGKDVERTRLDPEVARSNAELIREKPEQVLSLITQERSVFDRHDVARTLHRYIDDVQDFQSAFAKVMASPALVELRGEVRSEQGRSIEQARYSTRDMIDVEQRMASSAERLAQAQGFQVSGHHVEKAVSERALTNEQRAAVEHVAGAERIAVVVGLAGAGKSTMLAAAREAWEGQGYQVHGAALAGKAAEGLEESSGIASRTLASWSRSWERGFDTLGSRDVFVIDEAGMVGSRQLGRFIEAADRAGAKIVLVGDPEQLQPIGAGAAFRAVADRVGFVELEGVRRQREDWQRAASVDFGRHRTAQGLEAYQQHGAIRLEDSAAAARQAVMRDVLADMSDRPEGSRLVLAHRRADVQELNEAIRMARQERGELQGERHYHTAEGQRAFAPGDRLLFRENNRDLGVKNGMLGTVERAEDGHLTVRLDTGRGPGQGRAVAISTADYAAIDHGYATTIHKAQGATVDRAYVLASGTMDRHLTYVAMTRHRDAATLYADRSEFADRRAGRLVEQGAAPYEHKPGNSPSYFATLETDKGERHTTWGVDLERAIAASGARVGDRIGLQHVGSEPVRLPDGQTAERNTWHVGTADELARAKLVQTLGREGTKETTLDYEQARYSARRGLEPHSEIVLPQRDRAGLQQEPKRGMFDGLQLGQPAQAPRETGRPDFAELSLHSRPLADTRAPINTRDALTSAIDRYARAWSDAERMRGQGLPLLDHQQRELRQAGAALDAARPGAAKDLANALANDPAARRALTLEGIDRTGRLAASLDRAAQARRDPEKGGRDVKSLQERDRDDRGLSR